MSEILNFVRGMIGLFLFCTGVFIIFFLHKTYQEVLDTYREKMKEEVLYQQGNIGEKELIITYPDLMATLFYPLEYDIKIDNRTIYKLDHNIDKITHYEIHKNDYEKSYQYDDNGNIKLIIYTSMREA